MIIMSLVTLVNSLQSIVAPLELGLVAESVRRCE
jgi:hypothetical protein